MWPRTIFPLLSEPLPAKRPVLQIPIVTVRSALTATPKTAPLSHSSPVGTSTETTNFLSSGYEFMNSTDSLIFPEISLLSPVPSIASTKRTLPKTSLRSISCTFSGSINLFIQAEFSGTLFCSLNSAASTKKRGTSGILSAKIRSRAKPSPPFPPLPEKTTTFSGFHSSTTFFTSVKSEKAAFSIRIRDGIPDSIAFLSNALESAVFPA